jgi:hypothetical protein
MEGRHLKLTAKGWLQADGHSPAHPNRSGTIIYGDAVKPQFTHRLAIESHQTKANVWVKASHLTFKHLILVEERGR